MTATWADARRGDRGCSLHGRDAEERGEQELKAPKQARLAADGEGDPQVNGPHRGPS